MYQNFLMHAEPAWSVKMWKRWLELSNGRIQHLNLKGTSKVIHSNPVISLKYDGPASAWVSLMERKPLILKEVYYSTEIAFTLTNSSDWSWISSTVLNSLSRVSMNKYNQFLLIKNFKHLEILISSWVFSSSS